MGEDDSCASPPPLWSSGTAPAATLLPLLTTWPLTTPLTRALPPSVPPPPKNALHHGVASQRQTLPPARPPVPPLPHAPLALELHLLFVVMFKSSASLLMATLLSVATRLSPLAPTKHKEP